MTKEQQIQQKAMELYPDKSWHNSGMARLQQQYRACFHDGAEWALKEGEGEADRPQKMGIGKLRNLLNAFDGEEISMSKFLEEINRHFIPEPPKPESK